MRRMVRSMTLHRAARLRWLLLAGALASCDEREVAPQPIAPEPASAHATARTSAPAPRREVPSAFPPERPPRKLEVPTGVVTLNLVDVAAEELAEIVAPILGEELVVDPSLAARYDCRRFSFVDKHVVTPDRAAAAQLLATANLRLVRAGDWWAIAPGPDLTPCPAP